MLFYLIINGLSATADEAGRESADRFSARNNRNDILCNSVSGKTEEHAVTGIRKYSEIGNGSAAKTETRIQ